MEESGSDQVSEWSEDEVLDNVEYFDLLELTEEERRELDEAYNQDDSGDELADDERLPLFYVNPRFEWSKGNFVAPERVEYTQRPGPVHVTLGLPQIVLFGQFVRKDL